MQAPFKALTPVTPRATGVDYEAALLAGSIKYGLGGTRKFAALTPLTPRLLPFDYEAFPLPAAIADTTIAFACGMEGRVRGGIASLCGYDEFAASSPPKKYRQKSKTGTMYLADWVANNCPQCTNFVSVIDYAGTYHVTDAFRNEDVIVTGTLTISYPGIDSSHYQATIANLTATGVTTHNNIPIWIDPQGSSSLWLGNGTYNNILWPIGCTTTKIEMFFDTTVPYGGGIYVDSGRTFVRGSSVSINSERDVWNFAGQYDPANCQLVTNDTSDRYVLAGGCFPLLVGGSLSNPTVEPNAALLSEALTPIQRIATGTDVCTGISGTYYRAQGTITEQLSDEDTDLDAINRLMTGSGAIWSAWAFLGNACAPNICARSSWQIRTTGFDLAYQESQFRVTRSQLRPNTQYTVRVQIWRRPFGGGGYTLYQTFIYATTSTSGGVISFTDDVPIAAGYDTYAANATLAP